MTRFQQFVFVTIGAAVAVGGAASVFAGRIFFHASQENFGWVFAPFAVIVGALMILLALKVGRQRP